MNDDDSRTGTRKDVSGVRRSAAPCRATLVRPTEHVIVGKKASEDCSAKGTAEKHVTSNEMPPLQPSPRVVNQPTEVTGDAVASHAQFTAENKRPTVADQTWAQLAYQGRHSPSLASSSSSGTPSMATSTSGMVAQRASCDASARCLSRDDNYMIAPSLPFM